MRNNLLSVLLLLLLGIVSAQMGANYEVIVNQDGGAFVLATFSGQGPLEVSLPADVAAPYVKGVLYTKSGSTIFLSLTEDRMATVSYRTEKLVSKNGDTYSFALAIPENITNLYASASLPKQASVSEVTPSSGVIMSEEDSVVVAWASTSSLREVKVDYVFFSIGGNGGGGDQGGGKDGGSGDSGIPQWLILAVAIGATLLLILLVIFFYYFNMRKPKKGILATEGMRNVMKALNENDVKIVERILEEGGEIKRSELERKCEIAKSSLALSLDRLEQKGLLKIDKETTTHRVSLSEWFRSL